MPHGKNKDGRSGDRADGVPNVVIDNDTTPRDGLRSPSAEAQTLADSADCLGTARERLFGASRILDTLDRATRGAFTASLAAELREIGARLIELAGGLASAQEDNR
jgi:hypothetical protein